MRRALVRASWLSVALALLVLPLLPLPHWTGASDTGPDTWTTMLGLWGFGALVVGGVAYIASRVEVRSGWGVRISWPQPRTLLIILSCVLTIAALVTARVAFGANPQLIDESAQLLQARAFAAGHVAAPAPANPVFFLTQLTTVTSAGWVAQFPPGGSAVLVPGLWLGLPWIVNPILAGICVWLVYWTACGLYGPRTGLASAVAWTLSAFVLFMSASYMNHVAATAFALATWAMLLGPRYARSGHALAAGFMMAACAATRPLDAVAAAVPIAVWGLKDRRWRLLPWAVAGGLPVMVAWAWLNHVQWGSALQLGYTALYGPEHGMGFHLDPYGVLFTPAVALNNAAMAVRRLYVYLYETPVPVFALFAVWAAWSRHRHWSDQVVFAGVVAGPALYFFYWHSGFLFGPRFYFSTVPWLAIGMARASLWLWARVRRAPPQLGLRWATGASLVVITLWSVLGMLPDRFASYRDSFPTFKRHPDVALVSAGVSRAVVLVPESWGSRVIATLWSLGAQPGLVERVYRQADACDLAQFVERARAAGVRDRSLDDSLDRFSATHMPAPPVRDWPDPTLRLRPRDDFPSLCRAELTRDQAGFTVFGNLAWLDHEGLNDGIVFARDLYDRNDELLRQYPGWPVYRYAPPAGKPDALPVFTRISP